MKTGKENYLKRMVTTFASFKKKQDDQKSRIKSQPDHGYYEKPASTYRRNRDIEIYKLSKTDTPYQIMNGLWSGHPFSSDKTCIKYIERCTRNRSKLTHKII